MTKHRTEKAMQEPVYDYELYDKVECRRFNSFNKWRRLYIRRGFSGDELNNFLRRKNRKIWKYRETKYFRELFGRN